MSRHSDQPHALQAHELAEYFQQEAAITAAHQRKARRLRLRYVLAMALVWLIGCIIAASAVADMMLRAQEPAVQQERLVP